MIRIEQLAVHYGERPGVRDVSMRVDRGCCTALVGPSGSGKTTLLLAIAGLLEPRQGRISIDSVTVSRPGTSVPPHRRGVGMVFQQGALWPHMSVREHVAFGLSRRPRAHAEARTAELLRQLHLEPLAARRPHELSGGEAQRVALARALAPLPKVLLLDEPLSAVDAILRPELLGLIRDTLERSGVTAIYVTQHEKEAREVASEVTVLAEGRVLQSGSWNAVRDAPASALVARILGH